jgi:hypothetical protein
LNSQLVNLLFELNLSDLKDRQVYSFALLNNIINSRSVRRNNA